MKGMTLPRGVTALGLLMALAAVLVDREVVALLAPIIGANAAAKLGALGALLAAFGRAVTEQTAPADSSSTGAP